MIVLLASTYGGYGGYGGYGAYGGYGGMWSIWGPAILQQLLYLAPTLGVWALGLVLSIVALRRSPVALALVVGASLSLMVAVGLDFAWLFASFAMNTFGLPYDRFQSLVRLGSFAARLAEACSWMLLLLAIPAGRVQKPDPESAQEVEPAPM